MKSFSIDSSKLKYKQRLVPELYFYTEILKQKLMKDGLEYEKIGEKCIVSDGEHSAIPRNNISGIRYLYGRNVKEGVIDFDPISDDSYIDESDYNAISRCHINQNDVLIAIYGTVGKSALYKQEYVGLAGIPRHISNITVSPEAKFSPEFLAAFFRSKIGKHQIFSVVTGNIQQLFSLNNIRDFDVPILQKDFMDKITAREQTAINYEIEANHLLNKAKELFYSSLPFDIKTIKRDLSFNVLSSSLFDSNIWSVSFYDKLYENTENALKKECKVISLNEITNTKKGIEVGSDNYIEYVDKSKNDIPFIRTSDIVNHEVDLYPDYYVSPSLPIQKTYSIAPNDIIFTKDGKIGCVGLITPEDNVILSSGIEILRINETGIMNKLTPEYIFLALSIPEIGLFAAKKRTVIASTIPHIREPRLKEIVIPILKDSVISEITELVHSAFSNKAKRKETIKETDKMIEDYFSNLF